MVKERESEEKRDEQEGEQEREAPIVGRCLARVVAVGCLVSFETLPEARRDFR